MVNAQEWLDKEYPLGQRGEITCLDISRGKVKRWDGHERTLKGNLKLEGFANLQILVVSSHGLTSLDLSDCSSLEELDCHSNQLNNLNIENCLHINKIDCSNNNIKELSLREHTKLKEINCASNDYLEEINVSKCLESTEIGVGFTYDIEGGKLVRGVSRITPAKEDDIRNILIVGITGSGKSTLANVLTDSYQFEERTSSTSVTKNFQKKWHFWMTR